jgi:hypothetical protein
MYYIFILKTQKTFERCKIFHEVKCAVENWFADQDTVFFFKSLELLYERSIKCVSLRGEYVE